MKSGGEIEWSGRKNGGYSLIRRERIMVFVMICQPATA